ncbi:hypothetical protein [Streptomyces sp. NPDC047108]
MSEPTQDALGERLDAIARQPFRAKSRLRGRKRSIAQLDGPATLRRHA